MPPVAFGQANFKCHGIGENPTEGGQERRNLAARLRQKYAAKFVEKVRRAGTAALEVHIRVASLQAALVTRNRIRAKV